MIEAIGVMLFGAVTWGEGSIVCKDPDIFLGLAREPRTGAAVRLTLPPTRCVLLLVGGDPGRHAVDIRVCLPDGRKLKASEGVIDWPAGAPSPIYTLHTELVFDPIDIREPVGVYWLEFDVDGRTVTRAGIPVVGPE